MSDWTILASDNITKLSLEQALELECTLRATEPKVQKIEVHWQATMDDIQADLRVLHCLTCPFARRAGITQEGISLASPGLNLQERGSVHSKIKRPFSVHFFLGQPRSVCLQK